MEYMGFVNLTPFAAEQYILADENGGDVLTLVVKATYDINGSNSIAISHEQAPINPSGEYYADPATSSLKYAPEADFIKLGTDIALLGNAYAQSDSVRELDVKLRVGPLVKEVKVFGDRVWEHYVPSKSASQQTCYMSSPQPFDVIPLVYERAFGGTDTSAEEEEKHEFDLRNPVGLGLVSKKSDEPRDVMLPNVEDPRYLLKSLDERPHPAGFGFIAPAWEYRQRFAGTYDEEWENSRMPFLPKDFDRQFYSAAHPELIAQQFLFGGEAVEILNACEQGYLQFYLPDIKPQGVVRMKNGDTHRMDMNLDTVVVNTDEQKLFLLWRRSLPVYKKIHDLLWAKTEIVRIQ